MIKIRNVLSLFNGIDGARLALDRAGVKYENYYASEIDKYALQISRHNYPDTIHLGDVNHWQNWDLSAIDLIIAGSPCTSLSAAANQKESGLEVGESVLFWKFLEVLNHYNPKYFVLENVNSMRESDRKRISKELRTTPILINSSLLSAQQRSRLYWTNIPKIDQPVDKKIYLKDVIESGNTDRLKSYCIDASYYKGGNLNQYLDKCRRQLVFDKPKKVGTLYPNDAQAGRIYSTQSKSVCLNAEAGGGGAKTGLYVVKDLPVMLTEARTEEAKRIRKESMKKGKDFSPRRGKKLQPRTDGKGNCLTTGLTNEHLLLDCNRCQEVRKKSKGVRSSGRESVDRHEWDSVCGFHIRKLLPVECERLQTYPDEWTEKGLTEDGEEVKISDTRRYQTLGNSFTVDVIVHILKHIDPKFPRKTNYLF